MLTVEEVTQHLAGTEDSNQTAHINSETPSPQGKTSTPSPETNKSASSPDAKKRSFYQGNVWPPIKCTPLCFADGPTGCSNAGKHHELIMTLAKCSNTSETDKTDFKKSLDKFTKTKWLRNDCVPDKNEKLRFPLLHWACILGKYKPLEYLVSEKGFELTVKVGRNQQGPMHSMVQHLSTGLNPKSSKETVCTMFGNIIDIFLKNVPETFCEKHATSGDTILHFLAKQCSSDAFSRMYLKTVLVKMKETDKISPEKLEEILSAMNKRGDSFLHVIVSDEESVDTLNYFFENFGLTSEKISKAKNNFGKTPRQIAVEKRSFKMLKALGAPDVVINSLKKAVTGGKSNTITPKRVRFADDPSSQKSAGKNSPAAKPSSEKNSTLKDKEATSTRTRRNLTVQAPAQEKPTANAAPGDQQGTENITSDQLQAEVINMCSCDPPTEPKEHPSNSTPPTKLTIEPFPQRFPGRGEGNTAPEKSTSAVNNTREIPEIVDVDMTGLPGDTREATFSSPDRNVFLSLSNTINSLTKGESLTNNRLTKGESLTNIRKRTASRTLRSRAPNKKRGRGESWSDSGSDADDDEDFALDDDSDDDMESDMEEEEEEEEEEPASDKKEEEEPVDDAPKEVSEVTNEDDIELETAPKHTPFCGPNCTSQHHKLLLSLMKCSNYIYGMTYIVTFMKQVNEYINQLGKFSDVRANADLPDPVASFKYPLVHWVCVLGKFKVLEKLAEMKEFNLAIQSERTGETGLHRMLLSLDRAMALRKYSVKTILEVFSKTLKTLTDNQPSVITACNKEGDTPFHCLAKVILDCKLEKMNTYEGYFEHLVKDLTRLETSGKLSAEIVKELLLKTNNSQETFLHILACRYGVGHRVIKSVLKNIDPEIMDVLKAMKNADGKTPSDLAEDLRSDEMARILRPRDQEPAAMDGDNAADELPQTPDHSVPRESPVMQSPPATLFHPMEYTMSPFVPDSAAARMRLFSIKKEPTDDDTVNDLSRECPAEVNDVPCTLETMETVPLGAVKLSPREDNSMPTQPTSEDEDMITPSSAIGGSESITEAAATSSPSVSANHHTAAGTITVPANNSKSTSTPSTSTNHNRTTSSPTTNHSRTNSGDSSIMSGIINMPQSDKLLNTLHTKFQEQLVQSEKGLTEKEDALVRVRQRITEAQERKQKLLQELEETWNEMLVSTREEGVIQSEIAAKKRDCERFKAELAKYETSLRAIRE